MSEKIQINKKDYYRVLLTETIPSDVPLIYSNEGFYLNSIKNAKENNNYCINEIFHNFINPSQRDNTTSPFKYKIIKNCNHFRTLSLIHPSAQISIMSFYKDHSDMIMQLCNKSIFSVRAPIKIANSYILKRKDMIVKSYKLHQVDTIKSELYKKTASSFFSYKGFTRAFKIYNSPLFLALEKKFTNLWLLDVANCFNNIYTHSISWAIKEKEYAKKNKEYYNQFSQKIDRLMQRSNNNETNGICVGSEFSRVFAEIIFQKIDINIEEILTNNYGLTYNEDYVILRYVDDYMIFSSNDENSSIIYKVINNALNEFNLYLANNKTQKYNRPLLTQKSALTINLTNFLEGFDHSIYSTLYVKDHRLYIPKQLYKKNAFYNSTINKVKAVCHINNQKYDLASSFLISAFNIRISNLINSYPKASKLKNKNFNSDHLNSNLITSLEILLKLIFFFYSVYPQSNSTNKVAQTIIKIDRFLQQYHSNIISSFRLLVLENVQPFLSIKNSNTEGSSQATLEKLNLLIAISEFDNNHLIEPYLLSDILDSISTISYFDIISVLYYCKNRAMYETITKKLEIRSLEIILCADLTKCSEALHLALDLSSCPFISEVSRFKIIRKLYPLKEPEEISSSLFENTWFVKWTGFDLYELLIRKELNPTY